MKKNIILLLGILGAFVIAGCSLFEEEGAQDKKPLTGSDATSSYIDRQQAQFQERMLGTGIDISRFDKNTLKISIPDGMLFTTDQYQITQKIYPTLDIISQILSRYTQTIVYVLGHTDNVGKSEYNKTLSERRAVAVAKYILDQGVDISRIGVRGYGEKYPHASNESKEGRNQNNRVEIVIRAIDQNNPKAAQQPIYTSRSN